MSVYTYILISAIIFIMIIFVLVAMLLGVKAKLLPSGPVKILINEEKEIEVDSGSTLLSTSVSYTHLTLPTTTIV